MEVGAVKQAFNNELILLKKNLAQARTQTINKLTRKAKTIMGRKAPINDKFKKKAESAVREVMIMKKIKPKELGQFIVTHKEALEKYINKPEVNQEKACARLLLHKALQEKYKFIRNRFSGVPIKDLFMSRQERLKLKKEAKEQQKNKKNKKGAKVVNAQGDWDVEDVKTANNEDVGKGLSHESDEHISSDESGGEEIEEDVNSDADEENSGARSEHNEGSNSDDDHNVDDNMNEEDESEASDDNEVGKLIKLKPVQPAENKKKQKEMILKDETELKKGPVGKDIETKFKAIEEEIIKKQNKKVKDPNKNRNLKEKLMTRKFNKEADDVTVKETKVVDPFFITSSGENYMSVAEPRLPDEVKDIHKQGNRSIRRARMFGHVPKIKPRQNQYESNDRYNRQNSYGNKPDKRHDKQNGFHKERFNDNSKRGNDFKNNKFQKERFNDNRGKDFNNDRFNRQTDAGPKHNFKDRNSQFKTNQEESKPEKLHPSWEAKKKQSGILPFQGKKIVFGEE